MILTDQEQTLVAVAVIIAWPARYLLLGLLTIASAHLLHALASLGVIDRPRPRDDIPTHLLDRLYVKRARNAAKIFWWRAPWYLKDPFAILGAFNDANLIAREALVSAPLAEYSWARLYLHAQFGAEPARSLCAASLDDAWRARRMAWQGRLIPRPHIRPSAPPPPPWRL